ncbi:hypothetical protein B0H10DRAFT_1777313 [Mycena sp. CBHHK59/15]|nr:hypothetical protein B0H10DRAFT_1777313 [Mycena sp. CBHHK59/15]
MSENTIPVVTGYYRYTDIWFVVNALPEEDKDPLKGVLAHDSLVHPEHPLHIDGVDGVSMFLGTFPNGQSRLLMSSAQVDYIRYWLHAMKLTRDVIPIPYSECLLTEDELRTVSPVVYQDGGSLRGAIKKIEKNNKRLKGSNPLLTSRRDTFERVRKFWAAKTGAWCAIDFECWEYEHNTVTEFGYSYVRWDGGAQIGEQAHFTVKYKGGPLVNGKYVQENREHYNFGQTQEETISELKTKISSLISDLHRYGPVYLVFHDYTQDMKTLTMLGAPVENAAYAIPDTTPKEGIFIVDTTALFGALEGEGNNKRGLQQVCNHLRIETEYLHNAGNDAHYTLLALREMASGEPLDTQREARWPNRTGEPGSTTGVTVNFEPHEENSDYSDQEGIMKPQGGYDPITGMLRGHA